MIKMSRSMRLAIAIISSEKSGASNLTEIVRRFALCRGVSEPVGYVELLSPSNRGSLSSRIPDSGRGPGARGRVFSVLQ